MNILKIITSPQILIDLTDKVGLPGLGFGVFFLLATAMVYMRERNGSKSKSVTEDLLRLIVILAFVLAVLAILKP